MPYELECYIAVVLFMVFGLIKSRRLVAFLTVVTGIFLFYTSVKIGKFELTHDGAVEPRAMVLAFFGGVTMYLYREKIRLNVTAFAVAFGIAFLLHLSRESAYLAAIPAGYMTVYLGLLMPKKIPYIFDGDYSYGIYLYAFPVQQSVSFLLPEHRHWWLNILLSVPITALFAVASWHGLEKHVMALKGRVAGSDALLPRIETHLRNTIKRLLNVVAARFSRA